jgi:hypothetical protein
LCVALIPWSRAEDNAASTPPETAPAPTASARIKEAFTKGKLDVNLRLRWENAEQTGRETANAVTFRARLGYTTAPLYGFQAGLEFQGNVPVGTTDEYKPYPSSTDPDTVNKVVVADPEDYLIDQGWGSYTRWDSTVKGGRQKLLLDNQRFIGPVGWRQLQQTYDAAVLDVGALKDWRFFYGYLWQINRIFGPNNPGGRWTTSSHLIHVTYEGCEYARVALYGYLLDITTAPRFSSDTFGASVTGKIPLSEEWKLSYRGEFAWQTDAYDNAADYGAPYYHLKIGPEVGRFNAGVAYEVLSSDNGAAVQTPLATLHAFNGWADNFLVTPADGLRDAYAWVGVNLPGDFPLKATVHKFDADDGDNDYGWELDLSLAHSFGKYFKALVAYARYDGKDGARYSRDLNRFWLQGEFIY